MTGTIGLVLTLAAIVGGWALARSLAFESGLLVGIGGTWIGLLVRVALVCDELNRRPGESCVMPDQTGWLVAAAAVAAVGLLLGWVAWRRSVRAS